ncbi:hypothetical protein I79_020032 [Cricetulus griseus]|uniref:Uncharacterized protein n=1 Tax=Cricetulus griseus TaxID=10029 RepID=G3I8Z9_CRIGR|nr:hypothetical protein I79_020032 [Cricetulus griseus]
MEARGQLLRFIPEDLHRAVSISDQWLCLDVRVQPTGGGQKEADSQQDPCCPTQRGSCHTAGDQGLVIVGYWIIQR